MFRGIGPVDHDLGFAELDIMLLEDCRKGGGRRGATLRWHSRDLRASGLLSDHRHGVDTGNDGASTKDVLIEGKFSPGCDAGRVDDKHERDSFWIKVVGSFAPFTVFVGISERRCWHHAEVDEVVATF